MEIGNRKSKIENRAVLPLVALALLTLLLTWPTVLRLRSHVPDRQDPLLNAWIMAWEAHQVLVDPLHFYDANIFMPQGNTLAFSELVLSTSALVMPLQWLTGDALLAYNVATLLGFLTTALGGYLLALYLTGQRGPALVAGVGLAWAPAALGHLSQVQLLYFGWLPLALLYLDRLLRLRRPRRDTALLALFLLLQALASFYSALFSAGACVLYVVAWLLVKRRLAWQSVAGGVAAALLVAAVLLPVAQPYFEVQRTLGAGWTLEQNAQFSASLQGYAYAPPSSPVWGRVTAPLYYTYAPCCPPDSLFPTATLLGLALLALVAARGGRRGMWLLIAAMGFLLSLGPVLKVRAGVPTGITLPYGWLWEHLPGFNAIRAPVRWSSLVTLALAMLAAVGLARVGRGRGRLVWLVALAALLAEVAPLPLWLIPAPSPFPSLAWLDAQPPTTILELPLVAERPVETAPADQPRLAWERSRLLEAQYFSTQHWHRTPDGYSGYVPVRHGDFARESAAFPSPRSIAMLRGMGVRYVVLHEADATPERLAAWRAAPLPEATRVGTDRVLALEPAPPSAVPEAWLPITRLVAGQESVPLALRTSGSPYVPVAREPAALTVRWEGAGGTQEAQVQARWPMIVDGEALMTLPVTVPDTGQWTLTVEGRSPNGEPFRADAAVEVVSSEGQQVPLPVRLLAAEREGSSLRLRWEAFGFLERYYSLTVRAYDASGTIIAQQSGAPSDALPTIAWLPGVAYEKTWTFDGVDLSTARLEVQWSDSDRPDEMLLWDGERFVPLLAVGK